MKNAASRKKQISLIDKRLSVLEKQIAVKEAERKELLQKRSFRDLDEDST